MKDKDSGKEPPKKNIPITPKIVVGADFDNSSIISPNFRNFTGAIESNSTIFSGPMNLGIHSITTRGLGVDTGTVLLSYKNDLTLGAHKNGLIGASIESASGLRLTTGAESISAYRDGLVITGNRILEMGISTVGERQNFLAGVNNFASQISLHTDLLKSVAITTGPMIEMARTIKLEKATTLGAMSGIRAFTDNMATVMAYGKAVENQFTILQTNPIFQAGVITLKTTEERLNTSIRAGTYISTQPISSPFIFSPQEVRTKEVIKELPAIKKELPVKTIEAMEIIESLYAPDTKSDDEKIITTMAQIKRAVKSVQTIISQTIKTTTVASFSTNSLVEDLTVGHLTYQKDGALTFKNKPVEMRSQMKTLCIFFMQRHKSFIDYSAIKDEIISETKSQTKGFTNTTKYVNELQGLLRKLFGKKVIFNHKKEGYIFDVERNSEN
jgi:hypothetical protein